MRRVVLVRSPARCTKIEYHMVIYGQMTKSVWIETFTPLFLVGELIIVYRPTGDPNRNIRITTHWKSIESRSIHVVILPNNIAQGCIPHNTEPNIYTCVDINHTLCIHSVMWTEYVFSYHRRWRNHPPRAEQPPAVEKILAWILSDYVY